MRACVEAASLRAEPKYIVTDLRQTVFSGLRWSAAGRLCAQVASWAMTLVVVRLLSPRDYGLLAMSGFFISYLLLLSQAGLAEVLVRSPDWSKEKLEKVQGLLLCVNAGLGLLLAASAPLVVWFFNEPRLAPIVHVLATQFVVIGFTVIPYASLQREMRFREISFVVVSCAVLTGLVTLALAYSGYGVWSLVISSLISLLYKAVAYNWISGEFYIPRFRFNGLREEFSFSRFILGDRTLWFIYSNADVPIIGRILGAGPTGIYAVAQQVASLPLTKLSGITTQVALPAFSRLNSDGVRLRDAYLKAVRAMSLPMFPVGLGISAVAPCLIPLVLGNKWAEAIVPLSCLAAVIPLRLISTLEVPLLIASGAPATILTNRVVGVALLPAAIAVGAFAGLPGVAVAWLSVFPIIFAVTSFRTCRAVGLSYSSFVRMFRGPAGASAAMWGCVAAALHYRWIGYDWLGLATAVALGALAYVAVLYLLDRAAIADARVLALDIVGR